jgi:hypothetical protein
MMKIIGKTGTSFLAEITEGEIAACCGFQNTYGEEWKAFLRAHGKSDYNRGHILDVGCEFHPKQISEWHYNLGYKHKQAQESAAFLRSLADMITHLPEAFTVPPTEAEIAAVVEEKGE